MNWTEEQVQDYYAARGRKTLPTGSVPKERKPRLNKLESAWAEVLELRRAAGEFLTWEFEGIRLQLAPGCWYTPDFFVQCAGKLPVCYETKGFMREAARVRLHVAAAKYPCFDFYLVRRRRVRDGGGWSVERIGG